MAVKRIRRWSGQGEHNKGVRYFAQEVRRRGFVRLWFLDGEDPDGRQFQPCAEQDIPPGWTASQVAGLMRQHTDGQISTPAYYSQLEDPPTAGNRPTRLAALLRASTW